MFDHLRQQSAQEASEEDSGPAIFRAAESSATGGRTAPPRLGGRGFLGLAPWQAFVLSLMLFLNVALLGCFALVAFDRIDPLLIFGF
jgi:hypothetical protein